MAGALPVGCLCWQIVIGTSYRIEWNLVHLLVTLMTTAVLVDGCC